MIYLTTEMKPKVEYRVAFADRIYGWKSLYVVATCEQEALELAIHHIGDKPAGLSVTIAEPTKKP